MSIRKIFTLFFIFAAVFLSNSFASAACTDYNLMQQGDGTADNSLSFVGFESAGGVGATTSYFKFTPASDMVIDKININLIDNSCFTSGNKVNIYISLNGWTIVTSDLELDDWDNGVVGNNTLSLISSVPLYAGTDYEINFEPINITGNAGLCKISTDTNSKRTSSYVFPLGVTDVCGIATSCACSTNIYSTFSYYDWETTLATTACTQVDAFSCTDYDNCEIPEPNVKINNTSGFLFPIQKEEQYLDYPDIELICEGPSFCGDGTVQSPNDAGFNEQCDGTDNAACGGFNCKADCTCENFCGDNITQSPNESGVGGPLNDGNEECDGTDDAACGGLGCTYCTCNPDPTDCEPLFDNTTGVVPCGRITDNTSTLWNETEDCKICHIVILANNIIDYLVGIVALVTVLSIIISSLISITSLGGTNSLSIARLAVSKSLIGFGIVLIAWVIVNTGMVLFGFEDPLGDGSWQKFDCNLNTTPTFCGDGIVNGLEVCDFNDPVTGEIACSATFSAGLPAHCSSIPVAGTQKCNQCCSGYEDCTALPPVPTTSTSTACSSTSPTINDFACCELVGCGKDGCGCCGRSSTVSMSAGYTVVQQLKPCGGVGGYNCRLGQSTSDPRDWIIRTNHTAATYRCWN